MSRANITIGADPEVKLVQAGKAIGAWAATKGTKDNPVPFFRSDWGSFMAQADNVAFELNFPVLPCTGGRFGYCAQQVTTVIKSLTKCDFEATPYAEFSRETLEHPLAASVGCSEDFLAYSEDPERPRDPLVLSEFGRMRFFGGHIHVGYPDNLAPKHIVVKFCDVYLGLPALASRQDVQGPRRKFYGLAGLYRPKPYGIEYRTLSNFWMNPAYVASSARSIERSVSSMMGLFRSNKTAAIRLHAELPWNKIRDVMAREDVEEAKSLVESISHGIHLVAGPPFIPSMFAEV